LRIYVILSVVLQEKVDSMRQQIRLELSNQSGQDASFALDQISVLKALVTKQSCELAATQLCVEERDEEIIRLKRVVLKRENQVDEMRKKDALENEGLRVALEVLRMKLFKIQGGAGGEALLPYESPFSSKGAAGAYQTYTRSPPLPCEKAQASGKAPHLQTIEQGHSDDTKESPQQLLSFIQEGKQQLQQGTPPPPPPPPHTLLHQHSVAEKEVVGAAAAAAAEGSPLARKKRPGSASVFASPSGRSNPNPKPDAMDVSAREMVTRGDGFLPVDRTTVSPSQSSPLQQQQQQQQQQIQQEQQRNEVDQVLKPPAFSPLKEHPSSAPFFPSRSKFSSPVSSPSSVANATTTNSSKAPPTHIHTSLGSSSPILPTAPSRLKKKIPPPPPSPPPPAAAAVASPSLPTPPSSLPSFNPLSRRPTRPSPFTTTSAAAAITQTALLKHRGGGAVLEPFPTSRLDTTTLETVESDHPNERVFNTFQLVTLNQLLGGPGTSR